MDRHWPAHAKTGRFVAANPSKSAHEDLLRSMVTEQVAVVIDLMTIVS